MPKSPGRLFQWARRVGRQPAVRKVAEPVLARYYSLTHRGLDARSKWAKGGSWEVAHWDQDWFDSVTRAGHLNPSEPLRDPFVVDAVDAVDRSVAPVRLLDVGAGPLTPLGKVHPRRALTITACDALATEYDEVLERFGIEPPVRTVFAEGEHLVDVFGTGAFELVHCGNALDHHYDPFVALDQMIMVATGDGAVLLNHYIDEGEFQRYLGMHQWNIVERDGHLIIWNRSREVDVTRQLAGRAEVTCWTGEPGSDGRRRVYAVARKSVPSTES